MQSFLYLLYLYVFLQYHGLSSSSSNSIYIYIHYIIDLLYIFRNHYYFNAERESAAYWCVLINCQKLKFCFNLLCINPHYAPYVFQTVSCNHLPLCSISAEPFIPLYNWYLLSFDLYMYCSYQYLFMLQVIHFHITNVHKTPAPYKIRISSSKSQTKTIKNKQDQ